MSGMTPRVSEPKGGLVSVVPSVYRVDWESLDACEAH